MGDTVDRCVDSTPVLITPSMKYLDNSCEVTYGVYSFLQPTFSWGREQTKFESTTYMYCVNTQCICVASVEVKILLFRVRGRQM